MKKILVFMALSIIFVSFPNVSAQEPTEPIILEQLVSSGDVNVKLEWPEIYPHELNNFKVSFYDPETGNLLDNLRLNYNVYVMQHDHTVEQYMHNLTTDGTRNSDILFPEESQGLAEIIVELKASSDHGIATVYNEEVVFSVNVVPEFGVIATIILAASFVPILLLSKNKLVTRI